MFKHISFFSKLFWRPKSKYLYLVILLPIFIFTLVACNENSINDKEVPVYQGMVVSETLETLSNEFSSNESNLEYGYIREIQYLNTEPINQDDPFETLDDGTIYNLLTSQYPVTQTEALDYYSEPDTEIYITVKLSNPDNYVILSFILNGVFYQSYQFQEGSDSENLILKVNTGAISGIKEYTIDAIKYIDGTEIKDVLFAGEKTITVGLKYPSEPSIIITNEVINSTSMSMTVTLNDIDNLSTLNKIVLYDGNEIIQAYDLIIGNNEVLFNHLNTNSLYQYAIISVYDLFDGLNTCLKQTIITGEKSIPSVEINNTVPTQTSIGFGITVTDVDQVGTISAIELYQGETSIESLSDLNAREFTGLLSDNEYSIKVTYTYDLNDGIGPQTFEVSQTIVTGEKSIPTVEINNIVPTQTSIGFGITVTDVDQVGAISAIELYQVDTLIESLSDLNAREFTGLLSDTEYTIKVTYTYDLNDGYGKHYLSINSNKSIYIDGIFQFNELAYDDALYVIQSEDKLYAIYIGEDIGWEKAIVLSANKGGHLMTINNNEELLIAQQLLNHTNNFNTWYGGYFVNDTWHWITGEEFIFNKSHFYYPSTVDPSEGQVLKSWFDSSCYWYIGKEHVGKIAYIVEIDFGNERQDLNILTQTKGTPNIFISSIVPTQTSIGFDITVTDVDQVGAISAIELYQGDTLIESLSDLNAREFTGLLSDTEYSLKVTYTYELNDGFGSQEEVISQVATTVAKTEPVFEIEMVDLSINSVLLDVIIFDYDYVGTVTSVEIYDAEKILESITNYSNVSLINLDRFTEYYIHIKYSFNLNDGYGEVLNEVIFSFTTLLFNEGNGSIENPFVISSYEDFFYIHIQNESCYIMDQNIDFNNVAYIPIQEFNGVFDGNYFTISNVNIEITELDNNLFAGLFGINKGIIKNLNLTNVNVDTVSLMDTYAGLLVGKNEGTIMNVTTDGMIISESSNNLMLGGLVGYNVGGDIFQSGSNVSITALSNNSTYAGGIIGLIANNQGATIDQVFASVIINANSNLNVYTGGLIGCISHSGEEEISISNFHSSGTITADAVSRTGNGGVIGLAYPNNGGRLSVLNGYTDVDITSGSGNWDTYSGGIIGYITSTYNAILNIRNVVSFGNITHTEECYFCSSGSIYGGIVTDGAQTIIYNSYGSNEQVFIYLANHVLPIDKDAFGVTIKSPTELLTALFFESILEFDASIWSLSDTYIVGNYPKLKLE